MSLRIGVVVPSWKYWRNPFKLQPLWELYYASLIRESFSKSEVAVIDLRGVDRSDSIHVIPEKDIYLYWIMKSADAPEIFQIASEIKNKYPHCIQIAGGTHVDFSPETCEPFFDVCLNGTAEEQIKYVVGELSNGKKFSTNTNIKNIKSKNFCEYGFTKRDFLSPNLIINREHFSQYGSVLGTGVYFSRGCNFKCKFCVYNNPSKFQFRLGSQIAEEIQYLKKEYGIEGVNLRDEVCLPPNKATAIDYLEGIGSSDVIWRGQTVPFAEEEIVKLAAESGLKELALGIESVDSDLVLQISNKPSRSISNNIRFIELLKKHEIKVKVCLIMGLPGESRQVVDRTIRFLEQVRPDFVALSAFDPIPGSPFYKNPKQFGIKSIDANLTKHSHLIYRFDDDEDVGLPFEYEEETPWGKSFSRDEILSNVKTVQAWIRERGMSY
jgi:radical SAM superfamily enzyme YgiQ (UPF0313 family)